MAKLNTLEITPLSGSRDAVLNATRQLIAEEGVENTTVRKIATAAGLSPGRIIQQFGSKGRLMFELFRRRNRETDPAMIEKLEAVQDGAVRERVSAFFEGMILRDFSDIELSREVMAHSWRWTQEEDAAYLEELQHYISWLAQVLTGPRDAPKDAHFVAASSMIAMYVSFVNRALHAEDLKKALLPMLMQCCDLTLAGLKAGEAA